MAYHLSRIGVEDDIPIDDFLPTENVYQTDSSFVGNVCLTSEEPSMDTSDAMSNATPDDQGQETLLVTLTIDIKVSVACNALHPEYDSPGDRILSLEVHAVERSLRDRSWYVEIVNYLAADVEFEELKCYKRKKFF